MTAKRDSLLILYDILKLASNGPVSITRVTYGANLNHTSAKRHLDHLQRRGLIEPDGNEAARQYVVTVKGAEIVKELERLLRNVGPEKKSVLTYSHTPLFPER